MNKGLLSILIAIPFLAATIATYFLLYPENIAVFKQTDQIDMVQETVIPSDYTADAPRSNTTSQTLPSVLSTQPKMAPWYTPTPASSWHWQLSGDIVMDHPVDVYDVDLIDTPASVIAALHKKNIRVICYFSAGTYENFRPDAAAFPTRIRGNVLDDWPDEQWLDISRLDLFSHAILARMDMAKEKGCDAIEPDNVDAYQNDSGFSLTYNDQLRYNTWLATEAHKRELGIGLKNNLEQIPELVNLFDFAVNEQCFQYEECALLLPFINQEKAVFGVEYELNPDQFCDQAIAWNFSWLKMDYELDGDRIACQ